ncbi:MAG: hypothetical protein AAFY41_01535 [Bacteroidota bacterium]
MVKFVSILISVVSFNFVVSFTTIKNESQPSEVTIEFSNTAVAIEGGQPVYEKGTKVWISNPQKESIELHVNEKVKEVSEEKVDISKIIALEEGTYTLMVSTVEEDKVFGFTIQ